MSILKKLILLLTVFVALGSGPLMAQAATTRSDDPAEQKGEIATLAERVTAQDQADLLGEDSQVTCASPQGFEASP